MLTLLQRYYLLCFLTVLAMGISLYAHWRLYIIIKKMQIKVE